MLRFLSRIMFVILMTLVAFIIASLVIGKQRPHSEPILAYQGAGFNGLNLWMSGNNRTFTLYSAGTFRSILEADYTFSPDGEQVAFALSYPALDSSNKLFTLFLADDVFRDVQSILELELSSEDYINLAQIRWSPDSIKLAFYLDTFGGDQLWIFSADGDVITNYRTPESQFHEEGGVTYVSRTGAAYPTFAFLGRNIVWSEDSSTVNLLGFNQMSSVIFSLEAVPGANLTETATTNFPFDNIYQGIIHAPDEPQLLYYDDQLDIVTLVNVLTGDIDELTEMGDMSNITTFAWSEDSSRIGWVRRDSNDYFIYTMSMDDFTVTEHILPEPHAGDTVTQLWLTENPARIILDLDSDYICIGEENAPITCQETDFFVTEWYGVLP